MKNILFIKKSQGSYRGGIEGKILSLAEELARIQNIQPVLLTSDRNSLFAEEFRSLGLRVYEMEMEGILRPPQILSAIDPIIRNHSIGIIQSHAFRESLIGRLYKRGRPDILHIFRVHTHIKGTTISNLRKYVYYLLDRYSSRWVDHFIVISKMLREELIHQSRVDESKIRIVYNGIPRMGQPDVLPEKGRELSPSMAIIGEVEERKQQHLAVEALKILRGEGLIIQLNLIGRGEGRYYAKLVEKVKALDLTGQVIFHGQIQPAGLYDILKDIPLVLLPSLNEGIPTSIIEAMSLQKIVITTPVGATSELIRDKANGFLHSPGDLKGLSSILKDVFTRPANTLNDLRKEALATYEQKFTLDRMIKGFCEIYEQLD